MDNPDELLNATKAGELKKVSRQAIVKAIQQGRLKGQRWGHFWLVRRSDLDAWHPAAGYPKGRPRKASQEGNDGGQ